MYYDDDDDDDDFGDPFINDPFFQQFNTSFYASHIHEEGNHHSSR